MSITKSFSAESSVESRPLAFVSAGAVSIPWTIWFTIVGVIATMTGSVLDLSWHMSIGRDEFWTPGHTTMGVGGAMAGLAGLYEILATTRAGAFRGRDASARILGAHGPGGAFLVAWGGTAMLASSPFDDWWHNAYGLDLNFITPPHMLLTLGYFAIMIGAMVWLAGMIDRSREGLRERVVWLFLIVSGVSLLFMPLLNFTTRRSMHTAACYLAVALVIPSLMIATGRGSRHKWGCTIVAAVYMGIVLTSVWLLPLFPAQPKIGPVYQNVTHMIPGQFPLLLIVPGFIADLLLRRLESRSSWIKAVVVGPAFVLGLLAVQWPFADFLMSPASRNWIFGTGYLPYYFDLARYDPYQFKALEKTTGAFVLTMAAALVASILTTRFGLAWGDWMRKVRR
ncbi:MAG TPA: hypothetical protein VE974_28355 [Thermoanaerobaculia bacterium]|nr:hypothetical protein [Thermoanaerobaculia bacterium]